MTLPTAGHEIGPQESIATLSCANPECGRTFDLTSRRGSERRFCSGKCRTVAWSAAHPRQMPLKLCGPKRRRDLQRDFDAWLITEDGQTVYVEALRRALQLREAGWKHYSMDVIVGTIRFDRGVKLGPERGAYKINDHVVARLARLLMANEPRLADFFTTRRMRGAA